ncbi:hypothetical protein Tco_0988161 [Tanacetum coccineum]|uniref:Uncharacterized protein n=1 Tax=Tanacetum coccineum TaxID=301880 RepID=A0ABQ5EQP7_9ASTR
MSLPPDMPTANLEDVFSSNFPNYVPRLLRDYIPTSPGKTYYDSFQSNAQLSPIYPINLKVLELVKNFSEIGFQTVMKSKSGIQGYLEEISSGNHFEAGLKTTSKVLLKEKCNHPTDFDALEAESSRSYSDH